MIIRDTKGNELLEMIPVEESRVMNLYHPVTHALVIVKIGDDYLLGWNKWRKDWEIFGGCMEEGESLRECVEREAFEEIGLKGVEYTFLGLMHFKMAPGYFNQEWHEEYGGLYGVTLPVEALETIEKYRTDKEEVERLAFYDEVKGKELIAVIDEVLLQYWK